MKNNLRFQRIQNPPYSFTIPLNKTQEVEVVFRLRTKGTKIDWGRQLLKSFQLVREKSKKYSAKEISRDITSAIKQIRSNA